MPSATGTAKRSAKNDETKVPKTNGAAPKLSRTGSQSVRQRNAMPKRLKPLRASDAKERMIHAMSTMSKMPKAAVTRRKIESPRLGRGPLSAGGAAA